MSAIGTTTARWWIPGPGEDETLRSIVERAQRLYGGEGDELRSRLRSRATPLPSSVSKLDSLSARELCLLARTIGVAPRSLFPHRLLDHPLLLLEDERRAYCPACWQEDLKAGRPLSFRRAWAGVFTLNCKKHGLPLHWASTMRRSIEGEVDAVPWQPQSPYGQRILRYIERFAYVMSEALAARVMWPEGWRGDAYAARALLMRCVVNLGRMVEHPPFVSVTGSPELATFVNTPKRRVTPLQESPWESVRSLGPPAWRRAALWMVSKYVMPGRQQGYWPEGLPLEAFAAMDAQWGGSIERRCLRRVQRYRCALRRMCRPFPVGWDHR